MASPKEETGSSHPSSASDSSDDSDSSQGSGSMVRVAGEDGARVTKIKGKKGDGEPKKEKRRKAKRACRPCQVAHLTCSQSLTPLNSSSGVFVFRDRRIDFLIPQVTIDHVPGVSNAAVHINARMECERRQST